jgi:5-methylcytosine-specific restriction endonuclease McrA
MEMTLVLNASYEPLKIVDWQRAIVLWAQQKVEVVAEHDREIRSAGGFVMRLPSVVRLLRFVRARVSRDYVPFTRANIYARDGYACQYCGQEFPSEELTFDHVVPESRGGRRDWTNIATACVACNKRKGARTPEEAGMALVRQPRKPAATPALRATIGLGRRRVPESWRSWLYWNTELET